MMGGVLKREDGGWLGKAMLEGRNVRPHLGPLPRGEEERCGRFGLADDPVAGPVAGIRERNCSKNPQKRGGVFKGQKSGEC